MTFREFKQLKTAFQTTFNHNINGRAFIDRDNAIVLLGTFIDETDKPQPSQKSGGHNA